MTQSNEIRRARAALQRKKADERDAIVRFIELSNAKVDTLRIGAYELTLDRQRGTFRVADASSGEILIP